VVENARGPGKDELDGWGDLAARRVDDLPPALRRVVAGLYRLLTGAGDDRLAVALAGDADPDQLASAVEVLTAALGPPVWTRSGWRVVSSLRPDAPPSAVAERARAHYASADDEMPAPIGELARQFPELAEQFVHTRQSMVDIEGGLTAPVRELFLCLLSAQGGYLDGARRHLGRALAAGLPSAAVAEMLTCAVLTHGAAAWEAYGRALWQAAGLPGAAA
jgi:alkylhydroperoxidase/carboxymuconolactone decarboxylase family protein YurZ